MLEDVNWISQLLQQEYICLHPEDVISTRLWVDRFKADGMYTFYKDSVGVCTLASPKVARIVMDWHVLADLYDTFSDWWLISDDSLAYVNGLPIAFVSDRLLTSLTVLLLTAPYSLKQQPHAQDDSLIPGTCFKTWKLYEGHSPYGCVHSHVFLYINLVLSALETLSLSFVSQSKSFYLLEPCLA
jgi:hypothetical protein